MTNERFWGIAGLAVVVLVMAFPTYYILNNSPLDDIERDDALCRIDRMIPQHDIVLVDATDKLPPKDIEETQWLIEESISKILPIDGKLTIVSFADEEDSFIHEMLSLCNPGRKEQIDRFNDSVRRAEARWNTEFGDVLEKLLEELETLPEADNTPLLESLEMISRRRDFRQDVPIRRIYIISDLLQNRNGISFYRRSNLNFETFSKTNYFNQLNIDLTGVDVIVFQIQRNRFKQIQGKRQRDFWRDLLDAWHAKSVNFH